MASADDVFAICVHQELRALLLKHFSTIESRFVAIALAYELASIIGTTAPDMGTAATALEGIRDGALQQIKHFGLGRPHP